MKKLLTSAFVMMLAAAAGCGKMDDKCKNVTCAAGQTCDTATGMCTGEVDKCAGVMCQAAQACDKTDGVCKSVCLGKMCAATQICNMATGECEDKCKNVSCSGGQVCDSTDATCKNPEPPAALGGLIDRMGRPGVNTALTNPFEITALGLNETSDQTKDKYNADGNVDTWAATWANKYIRPHLAILDGLDGSCTNSFGGNLNPANMTPAPPRYSVLAAVISGDALQLDTSKTTSTAYLETERVAVTAGATTTDGGGRTLARDVIDNTYSLLAAGAATGVTDGVNANDKAFTTTTFPFLAAPH